MRLRTAGDKIKIEHSIIDGVRPFLERLTASAEIRSVIPGDPAGAGRQGSGAGADHGADAEWMEGDRAQRRRTAGAVHQHGVGEAGAGGTDRAGAGGLLGFYGAFGGVLVLPGLVLRYPRAWVAIV